MLAIEAASTNERKEGGIWVRRMVQIIQGISIEHLGERREVKLKGWEPSIQPTYIPYVPLLHQTLVMSL
jgi:hypothetical protein